MILTQEKINEFKAIYLKVYGEEISDDEARDKGARLVRLLTDAYRPLSDDSEII